MLDVSKMKEVRDPQPSPPIRRISDKALFIDLFRIQCFFHASKSCSSAEDDIHHIPASQLLADEVQSEEIVEALVSASIKIRLLDEQLWEADKEIRDLFKFSAGKLWSPLDTKNSADLSLRKACNKIIHAEDL